MLPLFPCYLRMVRERWALTQEELGELLGFSGRSQVSRLENCRSKPVARTLLALEIIFGKPASMLFPEHYDHVEDEIVRNLYRMQQRLEDDDSDKRAVQTKHQLLAEAMSRAALRTKQPMDYGL